MEGSPRRKGEHGKILICGGSQEYTGAPFYTGTAALLTGADLVWVACTPSAAPPLKALSPELIILPAIPESASPAAPLTSLDAVLSRVHCLVLGPGLGRAPSALEFASTLMASATAQNLPLVVDGDALYLLSLRPGLLRGHSACVLTPNANEWERLEGLDLGPGLCVLKKGEMDRIVITGAGASAPPAAEVAGGGSPRRCGGQGDVLAGAVGTWLAWAAAAGQLGEGVGAAEREGALVGAACGGALLVRGAAAAAFATAGRATLTPAILGALGGAFTTVFPEEPRHYNEAIFATVF